MQPLLKPRAYKHEATTFNSLEQFRSPSKVKYLLAYNYEKIIDNHSRSISLCKAQYQWHQHNISTSAYHYNQTLKTCYLGHLNGVSPVGELTDNINVFTSSYDFEKGTFQKDFVLDFGKFVMVKNAFYIYNCL